MGWNKANNNKSMTATQRVEEEEIGKIVEGSYLAYLKQWIKFVPKELDQSQAKKKKKKS